MTNKADTVTISRDTYNLCRVAVDSLILKGKAAKPRQQAPDPKWLTYEIGLQDELVKAGACDE